jgi:hypothetical protein
MPISRIEIRLSSSLIVARVAGAFPTLAQTPGDTVRITAIQARLFFEGTGTFSRDVLGDSQFKLSNTPIGEGSAETPSHSTLVLIEGSGPAQTTERDRRVRFTATCKQQRVNSRGASVRDVAMREDAFVGSFSSGGKAYVGFRLYETGCAPVTVTAQLTGPSPKPAVRKSINFQCGE